MVYTSDVIKRHSAPEDNQGSKFAKLGSSFISALSLSWADTAFSTLVSIGESILKNRIQDLQWNKQLEQCFRAADNAAMSQKQIDSLLEITTEILGTSTIDIHQFLLNEKYIEKLASDLAGNDDSNETQLLSRVLANVFHLLSDALYNDPEFNEAVAEIIRSHEHELNDHAQILRDHEERIHRMECVPHDVEDFIKSIPSLRLSKKNMPFAYNYNKMQDILGRETQIEKLADFAEDDSRRFLFWVITGPAGIGKSKLVFHFGRIYHQEKDWLVRELDRSALQELCIKSNWTAEKNILLIIDYANEQEHLSALLSKLSRLRDGENYRKVRVVLIAREGTSPSLYNPNEKEYPQWYADIVHDARSVNDHLYLNEFIELEGLSIEDCIILHKAYAENHLRSEVTVEDEANVKYLMEQEVLDDNGLARPLYALFVIDSYYKSPESRAWDLESLQKQIYERDWANWKTAICGRRNRREDLFTALTNLLLYATVFGRWESGVTLPEPLSADCETVFDALSVYSTDYKVKYFKLLTGKSVIVNDEPALVRLTPDMVGEYYVLRRLASFSNKTVRSWAALMASHLVDCKDFFIRAIQDYGNHRYFIKIFLKLFRIISELLKTDNEEARRAFAAILETFFRNYQGNEDDQIYKDISSMISHYIAENEDHCIYAAELALLFHENRPHIGNENRMRHFKRVEILYSKWPESRKIASIYISFLGDIAASKIGANAPGYRDPYIEKFENLSSLTEASDHDIQMAFIPVLIKTIERAISVHDWKRVSLLVDSFLKRVMNQYDDKLALDFISRFDSVIISLVRERGSLFPSNKPILSSDEQRLKEEIDYMIKDAIDLFKYVIDNTAQPSVNFIWTYVGKMSMITKNLFINQCSPHNKLLFEYMLNKLQEVYNKYYSNGSNILTWRVIRALDEFCDAKSDAIPSYIKAKCVLKKPD